MLVGMNQHEVQNVQQISQPESPKFEVDVTDYKTCLESNLIGLNAITYVSGYLLNSLGPVYEFVCVSFTTGNLNCFRVK